MGNNSKLLEVGELLHLARSGRLIVSLSRKVDIGTVLVDEKGRKVGKVLELIGPVKKPYASVIPLSNKAQGKKGDKLFIER